MSALYNLVMYSLVFGAMAVMFGTLFGIALWLLKVAWRIATWLLLSDTTTTINGLQGAPPLGSYRV
jgi:hypothetical protein